MKAAGHGRVPSPGAGLLADACFRSANQHRLEMTHLLCAGLDAAPEFARRDPAVKLASLDAVSVDAVTAQYPARIAARAVETAIRAARGLAVENRLEIGTVQVTKESIARLLDSI